MGSVTEVFKQGKRYGICFAPSKFVETDASSRLGRWAEAFIFVNYVIKTAVTPATDWWDRTAENPIENPVAFYKFLVAHDPPLRQRGDEVNSDFRAGRMKVPDIITNKPDRKDFYEIKPGSSTGKGAGELKLTKLDDFMKKYRQPYKRGVFYTPTKADDVDLTQNFANPIFRILAPRLGIKKIKVVLSFRRQQAGLVLYWICVDVEFEDEKEDETVENIGRWYTTHIAKMVKQTKALGMDLEINPADPSVQPLLPSPNTIRCALLTAPPAEEYVIVGGPTAMEIIREYQKIRMENTVSMLQVKPGAGATIRFNTFLQSRTANVATGVAKIAAGVTVLLLVVSVAVLITVGTDGVGEVAAAPAEGAAAGAGVGLLTSGVQAAAATATVETVGAEVISLAAARAAASAAVVPAAKTLAAAAGVLLVLGTSRNAFASGKASASPTVADFEAIRLVPRRLVQLGNGDPLGAVTLPGGGTGFNLGSVKLKDFAADLLDLEPKRPPAV